jgi:hypothetical protein
VQAPLKVQSLIKSQLRVMELDPKGWWYDGLCLRVADREPTAGELSMAKRKQCAATKCNNSLHSAPLTVAQENAVDALVSGKNDAETATLVGVHRVTVTRWRLYSPSFQAALNVRRAEVWSVGAARLTSLIPKALDAIGEELDNKSSRDRVRVALELLRLLSLGRSSVGPLDAEVIVQELVATRYEERRSERFRHEERERTEFLDSIDGVTPLPTTEELRVEILGDLANKLNDPADETQPSKT